MILQANKSMICIDEKNTAHVFKHGRLHTLEGDCASNGLKKLSISLTKEESERLFEMEDFAQNLEQKFLQGKFLYSPKAHRKIFYSGQSDIYFIMARLKNEQHYNIFPFENFDTLFLGEESENIDELTSSLAMELGMLTYNPEVAVLLE